MRFSYLLSATSTEFREFISWTTHKDIDLRSFDSPHDLLHYKSQCSEKFHPRSTAVGTC